MTMYRSPFKETTNTTDVPALNMREAIRRGDVVVIDVRPSFEYLKFHLPGTINLPASNFDSKDFEVLRGKKICLVCETGMTARSVANKLDLLGYNQVFMSDEHYSSIRSAHSTSSKTLAGWDVDRQFRLFLGVMLSISLLGYGFSSSYFLVITGIIATGLTITSLINQCFLRDMIEKMPWNKK